MLMWGCVYQGYNAVFPAFFQELFPTKTRVTAFAVSQNLGTLVTAFLPAIYAALVGPTPAVCAPGKPAVFEPETLAPSGDTCRALADSIETSVVWTVGSITFGLAIIAAIAAFSARETFRVHMNDLGNKDAVRCRRTSTSGSAPAGWTRRCTDLSVLFEILAVDGRSTSVDRPFGN